MTITNRMGLPAGLVAAVSPDRHNAPGSLSATTLLKGVREIVLSERHWEEMSDDAADRIWAVFGTAVHALLEREGADDFTEETLSADVEAEGGARIKVTGRIDNYNMAEGVVTDYKTASTWKVKFREFGDWRRQGLIYSWLLWRNGFPIKKCRFVALLKDHSKSQSLRSGQSPAAPDSCIGGAASNLDGKYPPSPVYIYEFPVTGQDLMETGEFVQKRVAGYLRASRLPDGELPECTAEERWATPDKWAVMRKGRKSAVRVLDSREEAEAMAASLGAGHSVEFRRGESRKCAGYCSCREFCRFWRENCKEREEGKE